MVDFIKTWGTALVAAAIVGAMCNMLLPKNSMTKVVRVIIGLYLAIVIVAPFIGADIKLPESVEFLIEEGAGTQVYDEAVLKQTSDNIEREVTARLSDEGIECDGISVTVNINETDGVYCENVTLILSEDYRHKEQAVSAAVEDMCGVAPEILFQSGV